MGEQDAQGEKLQVAVAVGAPVEYADLVVDALQRTGRDGAQVVGQDAVLSGLQGLAEASERAQPQLGGGPQPVLQHPEGVQLRRLLPQQAQVFLEQVDLVQGVVG